MEAAKLERQLIAEEKSRVAEKKAARETLDNQWRSVTSRGSIPSVAAEVDTARTFHHIPLH